ncbi:MAG: 23S rRNA (pseudouridine(1915)-N(3))-methyltransferase RlmH [Sphingomonadales bacterium]|nr:23S rRNA (pseudouridine(1915)-N(3))-methyltransferase RlmH [Sphingomonadales bacterium]
MQHIRLICVGQQEESFIREGIAVYEKRLKRFTRFEQVSGAPSKSLRDKTDPARLASEEAAWIRRQRLDRARLVLLDEQGTRFDSRGFAEWLQSCAAAGHGKLDFVVGGAYGLDPVLRSEAHQIISLSPLTFTHQMVRLIFVEQLYRAFTQIHNLPYHNDGSI